MKKILSIILSIILTFSFTSCTKAEAAWQEQYDLGLRYLSELEYESAIQAFNEAIKIDPKQVPAYIGLAQIYSATGDKDKAREVVEDAKENVDETEELIKIAYEIGIILPNPYIEYRQIEETVNRTEVDGTSHTYNYDENGHIIDYTWFDENGNEKYHIEFDDQGNKVKESKSDNVTTYEYDENNNLIREFRYYSGRLSGYTIYEYDNNNNLISEASYDAKGNKGRSSLYEYDENGNKVKDTMYKSDGTVDGYWIYEYDRNSNCIRHTEEDGTYAEYKYDSNGNKIEETYRFPNGNWTTEKYEYNDKNQLVKHIDYVGRITTYEYDEYGNKVQGAMYDNHISDVSGGWYYYYDKNNTYIHTVQKYEFDDFVSVF